MTTNNLASWLFGVISAMSFLVYGYSAMADRGADVEEPIYKITFKISPGTRGAFFFAYRDFC